MPLGAADLLQHGLLWPAGDRRRHPVGRRHCAVGLEQPHRWPRPFNFRDEVRARAEEQIRVSTPAGPRAAAVRVRAAIISGSAASCRCYLEPQMPAQNSGRTLPPATWLTPAFAARLAY